MEKYSFIMPVYFKEKPEYLRQSIDSMLAQTAFPDEIVIVKDGPMTPELDAVLDEYDKAHPGVFTLIQNETNIGLGKSLNVALAAARNDLAARMDSDDICYPERCMLQLKAFEEDPELDIVGTSTEAFVSDPDVIEYQSHPPATTEKIYEHGKSNAAFSHVSVMYRISTLKKYGCYGSFRRAQDTDLFCRMMYGGCKARNLQEVLVKVRKDTDMLVRSNSKESLKCILEIRRNLWKIGYMSFKDYAKLYLKLTARSIIPSAAYKTIYLSSKKRRNKKNKK